MRLRSLFATVAVLAIAPAAADAALPKPASSVIVPNTSLAGVKLNSSYAVAHRAWGTGGSCTPTGGCSYQDSQAGANALGFAAFMMAAMTATGAPKVVQISITLGVNTHGDHVFNTPLTRYKTSSGIGLGSTTTELKHAYSHLIASPGGAGYSLKGTGAKATTFSASHGRIYSIVMQSEHLG